MKLSTFAATALLAVSSEAHLRQTMKGTSLNTARLGALDFGKTKAKMSTSLTSTSLVQRKKRYSEVVQCKASKNSVTEAWKKKFKQKAILTQLSERLDKGRIGILAFWAAFAVYAFGFAPGGGEADTELLKALISNPLDVTIDPVYVFIFNSLGVLPAVYASLLTGGGKQQLVPSWPFVSLSFFLGFFALGPYLGLRDERDFPTSQSRLTTFGKFANSAPNEVLLWASATALYVLLLSVPDLYTAETFEHFKALFLSSRFVHISTLDFIVLSAFMYGPILEDMKRRNPGSEYDEGRVESLKKQAAFFAAVPVIGPAVHLLVRPRLPQ